MKTTKSLQLFGVLTITAALAVQVQAQSFLTNGLVAYYPFNGNANDESGNGHDGTPTTNATLTLDRFGFTNCAYAFDGVSAVITIPDSSSLDFAPTAPITVSLWAYRTTGGPVARHLMGKRAECELPANYQLAVNDGNGEGLMFGSGRAADGLGAVDTGVTLPTNVWKHLTGTFDGTAFRFYMNGTLIGTGSGSLSPTVSAPLLIGGSGSCGAANFGGLIDDVRIYNRALSSDEVAQLYALESPPIINIQKAVYLTCNNLWTGSNYQVQASSDLINWTNQGSAFTATTNYWRSTNYWDVPNWNQLFFRLQLAP